MNKIVISAGDVLELWDEETGLKINEGSQG